MKSWVPLLIVPLYFSFTCCFNLETRIPVIKTGHKGSYFGYSVAEHQSIDDVSNVVTQNWLLVGAPIDQNAQPKTNQSGALWKCPITTRRDDCQQVVTDGKRNAVGWYEKSVDSHKLLPPLEDEIKDGQWMGVTVKSQGPGRKVLVCAHRYIRKYIDAQWGHGLCYTLLQNLDYDDTWEPCKGRSTDRGHEEYGYCQAGTSGQLLDDDTALIGTPGVYTWRGTVYVMSVSDDYLHRDHTHYFSPHTERISPVDKYSYLGMSVTGAKFFGDKMSYAAGAPRSNGTGQVVIFSKVRKNSTMKTELVIKGEQFASSFGYEVATADLNGDGLPDLLVAAPFYFKKESGGAVYIYYNRDRCLVCEEPQKFTGALESRYGFAIAPLGDINKDGYDDIAIGAPYAEEGVVYIHLGGPAGLIKDPSQVIKGNQITGSPRTFGYSLSGKIDLDSNGYPDLLVGAYESDTVVLLRARPIIDIVTDVKPEDSLKNIDPTSKGCRKNETSEYTCFSFETCCNVLNTSADSLTVLHRIEAETFQPGRKFSRVWFGSDHVARPAVTSRRVVLTRRDPRGPLVDCQEHVVYLKENTRDIQSPIKLKLSYSLVQGEPVVPRPGDRLPSIDNMPILNQQEAAKILEVTFQKDCGTDDICQSSLQTEAFLDLPPATQDNQWTLMLGTRDDIPINITVTNRGESAYETQLFVIHPTSVQYNRIETQSKQVSCTSFNKTTVSCNIGNPFKSSSPVSFQVKFDAKQLDDSETQLELVVFANTTSRLEEPEEPWHLTAVVVKKAEVSLKGSARPEQVFYGGMVRGESAMVFKDDIGSRVVHTFQAYNAGPWKVRDLEVHVKWPVQVANNKPQGKWLLYLDDFPTVEAIGGGICYVNNEDVNPLRLEQRPTPLLESTTAQYSRLETTTDSSNYSELEQVDGSIVDSTRRRRSRHRRDKEMVIRADKTVDSEGHRHTVVNMNCASSTAKCLRFKCVVYNLQAGHEATIRVSGRLWNSTLVEDYPRVDSVVISSTAQLAFSRLGVVHQDSSDDKATASTRAYPEILDGADSEAVALWIIVVAVVAGILLLLLLVLVLWKVGFFKRRRPDPTLSGNLQKAGQD